MGINHALSEDAIGHYRGISRAVAWHYRRGDSAIKAVAVASGLTEEEEREREV